LVGHVFDADVVVGKGYFRVGHHLLVDDPVGFIGGIIRLVTTHTIVR
jgi:hypothetical protein